MQKKIPFENKIFIILLISLGFFLILLIHTFFKNNKDNQENHVFQQISTQMPSNCQNRVFLHINKSSYQVNNDNNTIFINECVLENTRAKTLKNWAIKIKIPENSKIESFWNCNISVDNNIMLITPMENINNTVFPSHNIKFGFFISCPNSVNFKVATISCNLTQNLTKNLTFFIVNTCFFLNLSLLIFYLVHFSLTKKKNQKIKQQKEQDDLFIKQTILTFVTFIDNKDTYTRGYSTRVANYSKEIARRMGMSEQDQLNIYYAGLMHDIGKITITDEILNKQTRLSSDEWEKIQMHTANGAALLKNFTILPMINDAVLYHHERYDGTGYINRLSGEKIPLVARIVCIADSYDAMASNRCYRLKFSEERIIQELNHCSGKQFDPKIVPYFIEIIKDGTIYKI